jgi:hypothetical protein
LGSANSTARRRIGLAFLIVAAVVAAATSSAAQENSTDNTESVRCPVMTDSIDRLYLAFFNREPTATEFRLRVGDYRSGLASLQAIAGDLATSDEFRTRYGNVDDDRYVDLVYRNVLRRDPTTEDETFWSANLSAGYDRGLMMLAFSESEEFVRRTGTTTPLAGFLRWYPEGTHWYCGVGPRTGLDIKPLDDPTVYADFMFINSTDGQSPVGITTLLDGLPKVEVSRGSLPPGFSDYRWGGQFNGDGQYGSALSITAAARTSWIVAFYPSPIGDQRLGWQIAP